MYYKRCFCLQIRQDSHAAVSTRHAPNCLKGRIFITAGQRPAERIHPASNCLKGRIFITAGQRPAERIPIAYRRLGSPAFQAGGSGGYLPPQVVDLR
jgi:hypothetical protein